MNIYGTHVPVLKSIGNLFPNIERIMEYGSGQFSTLTFLNRDVFPNLEKLVSTETNSDWADEVTKLVGYEERWTLVPDDEADPSNEFGLIFVDSLTEDSRNRTVDKLIALPYDGIVVFHDSQNPCYEHHLAKFQYRYRFTQHFPNTDILSISYIPMLKEVRI
jgi:hypothetical protein